MRRLCAHSRTLRQGPFSLFLPAGLSLCRQVALQSYRAIPIIRRLLHSKVLRIPSPRGYHLSRGTRMRTARPEMPLHHPRVALRWRARCECTGSSSNWVKRIIVPVSRWREGRATLYQPYGLRHASGLVRLLTATSCRGRSAGPGARRSGKVDSVTTDLLNAPSCTRPVRQVGRRGFPWQGRFCARILLRPVTFTRAHPHGHLAV